VSTQALVNGRAYPAFVALTGEATRGAAESTPSLAAATPIASPITYVNGRVQLDLPAMAVGRLYPLRYDGVELVARKNEDGSVDFYGAS
jgi:hypothetical protein